jgi:hypothetical protein
VFFVVNSLDLDLDLDLRFLAATLSTLYWHWHQSEQAGNEPIRCPRDHHRQ